MEIGRQEGLLSSVRSTHSLLVPSDRRTVAPSASRSGGHRWPDYEYCLDDDSDDLDGIESDILENLADIVEEGRSCVPTVYVQSVSQEVEAQGSDGGGVEAEIGLERATVVDEHIEDPA